jgi:predicted O-methyltransferase YrrM
MTQLRCTLESILPPRTRRVVLETYYKSVPAPIRSFIQGKNRDAVFKQAMKAFLHDPGACAYPGHPVLADLIYGWGNEAWSAQDEYLASCISHALEANGSILECGSGLSTILLAAIAKMQGQGHWILEHKPAWSAKVQRYLNNYGLGSVINTRPLRNYGDFRWYEIQLDCMPGSFSLVICDGPPSKTKGGRYGLIPLMKERLQPGCVILLDDAYREAELSIAKRWETELGSSYIIQGMLKPYIKMIV